MVEGESGLRVAALNAVDSPAEFTDGEYAQENLIFADRVVPGCNIGIASLSFSKLRDDVRIDQVTQKRTFRPLSCLLAKSSSRPAFGISSKCCFSDFRDRLFSNTSRRISRCSASTERPLSAALRRSRFTMSSSRFRTMSCAIHDINDSTVKQVAIIGGGLAGLACAHALKRRAIEAVVFEAAEQAGGRDGAALFFLSPDLFRNTFKLLDDLGMAGDILEIPPHAGQVYKGRIHRHRVASATGLLGFKGLNIADKILLPRMAYLLARRSSHLDFHHPETGLEFDDETVASFVKRELSQNVLNYVAGPLISTLFFYGSEETSNWLYLVLSKHMYNTRMTTVRGGVSRIAKRLAENLRIEANNAVRAIAADGNDYLV